VGQAPVLVLASASPRRRALLDEAGLAFEVRPADVDESIPAGEDPVDAARRLARDKARAVARAADGGVRWVLGADTVVALGGRLLGKPEDEREARGMLELLSGTRHRVITGVCVVRVPDAAELVDAETTWVRMRAIAPDEVRRYVASGEWRDKAGGYAIQETADRFVTELTGGGFDNVVGLPVGLALGLLVRLGHPGAGAPR